MNNTTSLKMSKKLPSIDAQELYALATSLRDETEKTRKLAPAIVERIKELEFFRMGLPKFLGGWEDNPVETLKVYEALSSAEASVAWIVWNNHLATTFGRYLDRDGLKEVYGNHSHVYANSTRPEGFAEIVEG